MLQEFNQHITKNFSFLNGKKVLIAVSGGVDSVVLTYLAEKNKNFSIALAHCNFKLRAEESDTDETFVIALGKQLNIATYTTQFNTEAYAKEQKLSIQLAARELRYNWFEELCITHEFDYVFTAHHANDNIETFFINLSRGTGLDGLTGIPEINGKVVRPLLPFPRAIILSYAKENNIAWREDTSNSSTKYLRNKIRHEIVPKFMELNPNFIETFQKTSDFLGQSQLIIADKTREILGNITQKEGDIVKFNISKLKLLSNPKAYMYQALKGYGFTEWDNVYALLSAQSGKQIRTKSHILLKDRDFLLLLTTEKELKQQSNKILIEKEVKEITKPINLSFKNVLQKSLINKNSICVDHDLLTYPLILRKWKEGDFFYPSGMRGKKKLSKYFKDEKISVFEKKNIWLLCSSENEVIWIVGKRQDRRFMTSSKTTKQINIVYNNH